MVCFKAKHRLPQTMVDMRADRYLELMENLPFGEIDDFCSGKGIVVFAPHPDDESLGCGGLISAAIEKRLPVHVVMVSDGGASHPGSRKFPRERVVAVRRSETLAALRDLGVAENAVSFLELPDGNVPSDGLRFEEAVARAAGVCSQLRDCVLFASWRHDPHPDHKATWKIAAAVAAQLGLQLWAYPVWGWTLPPQYDFGGTPPHGLRLNIERHLKAKVAAINEHVSQITDLIDDDPNGFRLKPEMISLFTRPFEVFLAS
jgi:LmbE family N-acetylglucosaminyl deacetylase